MRYSDMKKPELILAFDCAELKRLSMELNMGEAKLIYLGPNELRHLDHLYSGMIWAPRETLETYDEAKPYKHVIPYISLTKIENGQKLIFVYRRAAKVGEQRLKGMCSVGIGGHVEIVDAITPSSFMYHPSDIIHASAIREFEEEVLVYVQGEPQVPSVRTIRYNNLIVDNTEANQGVGKVHLGIWGEIDASMTEPAGQWRMAEEELETIGFMTPEAILADPETYPLETWSEMIVQYLAKNN